MMRLLLKILAILLLIFTVIAMSTLSVVDRDPYVEEPFFAAMDARLDSLHIHYTFPEDSSAFLAGWSTVNITPEKELPLAGYGARDPKTMDGVHDSSFVRTLVFKKGPSKVAIITADLLVIHPELSQAVWSGLPNGWNKNEIYFTATHTHCGQGAWAPGIVGKLFAGEFDEDEISFLAGKFIESIQLASATLDTAAISFGEIAVDDLVKNRLVKEKGSTDPWMKVMQIRKGDETGLFTLYSAHATCFGPDFRKLSGDYPAKLLSEMANDSTVQFAAYAAGAVGSMGPNVSGADQQKDVNYMAESLKTQLDLFRMLGAGQWQQPSFRSFQLKLPMREPKFKISKQLAIRPYLFEKAFGNYEHFISIIQFGDVLFVGLPCDFSGELAVPLYEYARERDIQLVISSFNGDYTGYIIKDEWYDLPKYEARTMSWYGPDAGSYLSEIVKRLINTAHEHH